MTSRQQPQAAAAPKPTTQQIIDALANGRNAEARNQAELALSAGEDGTTLFLLGVACLRIGDAAAAVAPLRRVLELAPEQANVQVHLGEALARLGQVPEAQACFREAGRLDPNGEAYEQHAVMLGRAVHFQKQGRGEQGLHRDVSSLLTEVASAVAVDDFAHALGTLSLFALQVLELQRSTRSLKGVDVALGDRSIDACIDDIGARVLRKRGGAAPQPRRKLTVHIVTRLYTVGGHTRLMRSYMDADDTREQVVLITDVGMRSASERPVIDAMFPERQLDWCPPGDQLARLHWLFDRLEALAPERVILFQHHHDPVAVAACQPELAPELYFMHHADYELSFGVFHPRAIHIDGCAMDFDNCRHQLGVDGNIFIPFVAEDRPRNDAPLRPGSRPIVTCTAATFNKLDGTGYRYNYLELFPWLFSLPVERHVHFGDLPAAVLVEIYSRLDAAGIARERFDYRGNVPSYWQALRDASVDVCIGSFPLGGGLTMVEAMGSGTPYIAHVNYQQRLLSGSHMLYPEGFTWRDLSELEAAIRALSAGSRAEHAEAARRHYERLHRPQILKDAVSGEHISGVEAPALRPYKPDHLQLVLDSFYAPKT
ncbi:MAG TPA: tetratricopeptide repeat protein [Polyangiales bacterium]|nr:tetratricopeptide repeat protein [Polyangiales bacterium]